MARFLLFFFLLLIIDARSINAQLSFQISNYDFNEQGLGNQNWDIASDDNERILVANNYGFIILENTDITFKKLSDQTIFRSVAYINDRIYTGSFEDFGYWTESESGNLNYTSLVPLLENPEMNNDEIWKIIEYQGKIYFHSFGTIYCYDGEKVYRLDTNGSFMFLYGVHGSIYTQKVQGGLYQLTNDEFVQIPGSDLFMDEEVKSIIELDDKLMLIGTTSGLYTYDGNSFKTWTGESREEVIKNNINAIIKTRDKIIIGTILNGLYIFDFDFRLLKNINTENELLNNTILSLETDAFDNLWVGMDKGLAYIAFDTPIHTYRDEYQGIGSTYTAALFNNELYIGTNQGIYWYKQDDNETFYEKTLIPNSQGQVWFLEEYDGKLYAGLNDGTYVLENKTLKQVSSVFGGYTLKPYQISNRRLLLQSTYSDLVVYEHEDSIWKQSYTISGFGTPARFMEFDHIGNIWLGHTVRGIFKLQPNMQFNNVEEVRTIGESEGLSRSTNRVFKLDNRIITSYLDSLFEWDAINETFVPFTDLDSYFTEKGTVKNIVPAGEQRYWIVKHNEIALVEIHFNSVRLLYRLLPDMYEFDMVEGYENIVPLTENLHLVCLDEGFAILNLDLVNQSKYTPSSVKINSIEAFGSNKAAYRIEISNSHRHTNIPNNNNNIQFSWATSQVVGNQTFFQYKLEGLQTDWTSWTTSTQTKFERLQPDDYVFSVRSIGTDGLLTESASFSFSIDKPWYQKRGAFIFYFLVLISFGFMIRLYISRKRWRELGVDLELKHKKAQRDREKAEQKIIKLTNEKLQSEIEHKSAQLASNTMAIMRKNNLLATIKDELNKQKKELGNKIPNQYFSQINSLIEKGIEDEHEWEVFEQLYDQAHGNFFKRLKEKYPQLTPSDLRLCAYLRMNLSSKEIAPLLNISVRGVEERRYRLRKRLDLSTDTNLTELIMTF